jgi:hypothetical protein
VFWAVPEIGEVSVWLDGVELEPVGDDALGRFQFRPPQPLSEGSHEVEMRVEEPTVGGDGGVAPRRDVLSVVVEAVAQPPASASIRVDAVTHYELRFGGADTLFPPPEALEGGCGALANLDVGACYDIIPGSLTKLDFTTDGEPLAWLVAGIVLPADCSSYVPYEYVAGQRAPYEARPILPTGLGEPLRFEGRAESLRYEPPPGTFRSEPPDSCSVSFAGKHRPGPGSVLLGLLAGALCLTARSRRRPR